MIEHLLHHDNLTKSIIKDDVEGHIGRGRSSKKCQIMINMSKNSYKELKNLNKEMVVRKL